MNFSSDPSRAYCFTLWSSKSSPLKRLLVFPFLSLRGGWVISLVLDEVRPAKSLAVACGLLLGTPSADVPVLLPPDLTKPL